MLYLSSQRPLVQGNGVTAPKVGYQSRASDNLWDNVAQTPAVAVDNNGLTYHRDKVRSVQFTLCIEGGFQHAIGVEAYGHQRAGRRGRASATV